MRNRRDSTAGRAGEGGLGGPGRGPHRTPRPSLLRALTALLASRRYVVRGDSMSPTFEAGQHLLASGGWSGADGPSRGDVVIVRDSRAANRWSLKRTVGLPGEEIRLLDGLLYVDGEPLAEPYLGGLPSSLGLGDRSWRLGDRDYFVLGDNRLRSTDSRHVGPVVAELILGRVWLRYWPLNKGVKIV